MRIAILSLHSSPYGPLGSADTGGMSIYIRETARHLVNWGHRVDIFTRRTGSDQPQMLILEDGLRLVHLPAGPLAPVPKLSLVDHLDEFAEGLEQFCSSQSDAYDVIHSHYWLSACIGQKVKAKKPKLPHLVTFHTLAAAKDQTGAGRLEPRLRLDAEKALARQCDGILVATEKEKALTHRHYHAPLSNIEVVPCGVDLDLFQPKPKPDARRQLGIGMDATVALYVGRFDAMKGIDAVIKAIALLETEKPVRLVLVGGDGETSPAWQRLQDLAVDLGIEQAVHFAGRIAHERMPFYYSAADVVAVASHYESFGLVALEALACGTPVASTRVGAMEQLINAANGCLIDSPSAPDIARGIAGCVSGTFRQNTTAKAIRSTVAGYDWSHTAAGLLQSYTHAR